MPVIEIPDPADGGSDPSGDPPVDPGNPQPAPVSLDQAKMSKVAQLGARVTGYIYSRYSPGSQATLNAYFTESVAKGWANRKAMIQSILDWINSVLSHYYTQKAAVLAAADEAAVEAVALDLDPFTATDPEISTQTVKETVD